MSAVLVASLAASGAQAGMQQAPPPSSDSDNGVLIAVVVLGLAALIGFHVRGRNVGAGNEVPSQDDTPKGDILMEF